jgi:DNA polymerase-3 subunit delta'
MIARLPKKEKGADVEEDLDAEGDEGPTGKPGDLRSFIVLSQIRELNQRAAFAPREAERRVFVVDPADHMNAEAQNALLKTLEEPPGRAVIVLIASRPHVVLSTVRSRCMQVGFAAMPPDDLARALAHRGMAADEARLRAALADGRPGTAIALDPAELSVRRDRILGLLLVLASSPSGAAEIGAGVETIVGDSETDLAEGFDLVAALLRDAARTAAGTRTILHADAAARISELASRLGAGRASDLVALLDRLRGDLRLNVNRALTCETLLAAVAGGSPQATG